MNEWKNKQKIKVDNNKETILNSQLKSRIAQYKILRTEHILQEKACVEEILSIYNTIIKEGINCSQEEYDKMKKLMKSLNEQYDEINKPIIDKNKEDAGKEI